MYDLETRFADGDDASPQVIATVAARMAGARLTTPDVFRLALASSRSANASSRAAFRHGTVLVDGTCSLDSIRSLALAGAPGESDLQGEYEDAIGAPGAKNIGNYGVTYKIHLRLVNPTGDKIHAKFLVNAAAGNMAPVLIANGRLMALKKGLKVRQSWMVCEYILERGASKDLDVELSLPGGTSGPLRLFFWPEKS